MTSVVLIFFETKSEHCCVPPVYVKALLNIQRTHLARSQSELIGS